MRCTILEFKQIFFKNILSFSNKLSEIDLTSFNNIVITGKNGHGKSTIIEAIYYALYGKPYRKTPLHGLINNVSNKGLYVKLEFSNLGHDYIIERGQAPNILILHKDGSEVKENVGKVEFQKRIDKIIGVDFRIFNQICLIDNTFYKPFMSLNPNEKRLVADNIFGLELVTSMAQKCKEYRSKINEQLVSGLNKIEITKEKIRLNQSFSAENIEKDIKNIEDDIKIATKDIQDNLKKHNQNNTLVENFDTKLQIKEKQFDDYDEEKQLKVERKNRLESDLSHLNKKLRLMKEGKCKECGQDYKVSKVEMDDMEKRITKVKDAIVKIETSIQDIVANKTKTKSDIDKIKEKINETKSLMTSLSNANIRLVLDKDKFKDKIKELNERKKEFDTDELEKELSDTETKYKKDTTMSNRVRTASTILSDTGIRSYIINKYLPVFNKSLHKYLQVMEIGLPFELNSEFNQHIDPRKRGVMPYEQLSSGQKARINLAIMFSLIEFAELKSGSRINLLMLDEVIEG